MNTSSRRPSRALIDSLECRRLLTVTFGGTNGNDTIIFGINGSVAHVNVNGTDHATTDPSIVVNTLDGNDSIQVVSTLVGSNVTVNCGNGNNTLQNIGANLPSSYRGSFAFLCGTGNNRVIADNSSDDTTPATITIEADSIFKNFERFISCHHVSEIQFTDSNGSNEIQFLNLQNFGDENIKQLTIDGNGGDDRFVNHGSLPTGYLPDSMASAAMTLRGGSGNDTLALDDSINTFGSSYQIGSSMFDYDTAFATTGTLSYDTFESFDLVQATGNDVTTLTGKPPAMALAIDAKDGNDTFNVGGGDLDSNGFATVKPTLMGGAGRDFIRIEDQNDDQSDGSTSSYALNSQSLSKGAPLLAYSGFENQTLDAANGIVVGQFNSVPTITFNAAESSMLATTINGGAARSASVIIGNGSLFNLPQAIGINLHGGFLDRVTISDSQTDGLAYAYQVTDLFVRRGGIGPTINYAGVSQMTLSTSTVQDSIGIDSTPTGMTLNVLADGGDDLVNFGGDIGARIRGPVNMDGGAGSDSLTITNVLDSLPSTQTLTSTTFIDGNTHTYTAFERLTLNEGPGGANLLVNSLTIPTTVTGGSGPDAFTVGGGNIEANFPRNPSTGPVFDGGGGTDAIILDDRNATATGDYTFERPTGIDRLTRGDGSFWYLNWANIESATLEASDAPTTGNGLVLTAVVDSLTPIRINGNGGSDAIFVFDAAFPVTVNTGAGSLDQLDVNFDAGAGDAPVTVIVDQNDEVDGLRVRAGGTLRVTSGATLAKSRLNSANSFFDITGVLDLAGGALLSRAGGPSPDTFRTLLARGYNGGAWNGTSTSGAINSSLAASSPLPDAIGYGLGSDIAISSIGGFNIAPADTLVRYTYYGDADLNGRVNFDDYVRTDGGFNSHRTGWANGDFDFNNRIDFDDYVLIDLAFNTQGAQLGRGV